MLEEFGPAALRDWVHALGVQSFAGASGRAFPREMKAALLRELVAADAFEQPERLATAIKALPLTL
jgi:predicted flavoprotein YhiN